MQILSIQSRKELGSRLYYSHNWGEDELKDFFRKVTLEKGEPVAIYSAPCATPYGVASAERLIDKMKELGLSTQEWPSLEIIAARIWANKWRRHVEKICEHGGTPVVLVGYDKDKSQPRRDALTNLFNVELLTIDEWQKRGGPWHG